MKKFYLAALAFAMALPSMAQELPVPSPKTTINQRVGLTDITLEYSRPGMNGRTIFGDLVPYGEIWRLGANKNTMISFNHPITWNGEMVPAGTYSLYAIPNKNTWTVILNSAIENWGTNGYSQDADISRTDVNVVEHATTERLSITIENMQMETGEVMIAWADIKVLVPFTVDVHTYAEANIKSAIAAGEDKHRVHRNAAQYYLQTGRNELALKMIDQAVKDQNANWYTHFIKGQILHANGLNSEAIKSMNKSIEIGEREAKDKGTEFGYRVMIEKEMRTY